MASRSLRIKVVPRSRAPGVSAGSEETLIVRVNAPPVDGKANREVIERLAEHLGVPRRRITIRSGEAGRHKVVVIEE